VTVCNTRAECEASSPIGTVTSYGATGSNLFDLFSTIAKGTGTAGERWYRLSIYIGATATSTTATSWGCIGTSANGTFTDRSTGSRLVDQTTISNGVGGCENLLHFKDL